ncbi:MAG: D-aminoacyl-tRNA deacylase [Exilispira sp.]
MVIVIQRVNFASCEVDGKIISKIEKGLVIFIGVSKDDDYKKCEKLVKKIVNLRIFEDENGKMNKNIFNANGSILVISQFTLASDINRGNRPSFDSCMQPDKAKDIYNYFVKLLKEEKINVEEGVFGEHMIINIYNDGPVTFVMDN